MDIGGWLWGLGLERYELAFRENEIDLRVLPELTADDLKELGVAAIGHRRLLLKAIADLAAGAGRAAAEGGPAASPANAPAEAERRGGLRSEGAVPMCKEIKSRGHIKNGLGTGPLNRCSLPSRSV